MSASLLTSLKGGASLHATVYYYSSSNTPELLYFSVRSVGGGSASFPTCSLVGKRGSPIEDAAPPRPALPGFLPSESKPTGVGTRQSEPEAKG